MTDILALVGALLIAVLCVAAYIPLSARIAQPDIISTWWGGFLSAFLLPFLITFACAFGFIALKVGASPSKGGVHK